jgi:GDPmannose 4,6-dehydratase
MLQQPLPDDYVLATGESHSVREFIELAFAEVGRRIAWRGAGVDEMGIDAASGEELIKISAISKRNGIGTMPRNMSKACG